MPAADIDANAGIPGPILVPATAWGAPPRSHQRVYGSAIGGGELFLTYIPITEGVAPMSEVLLNSIDTRLRDVVRDVGALTTSVASLTSNVDQLPTWKGLWLISSGVVVAIAGAVAWLINGGAVTLARLFGA